MVLTIKNTVKNVSFHKFGEKAYDSNNGATKTVWVDMEVYTYYLYSFPLRTTTVYIDSKNRHPKPAQNAQ